MYKVLNKCVCLALEVRPASGLHAYLEAERSKEHVRSVLLSHTMSAIIVRELQVKRAFSEIVHTK
jgi:PIN domain nuclease of toxin-antitoxin system